MDSSSPARVRNRLYPGKEQLTKLRSVRKRFGVLSSPRSPWRGAGQGALSQTLGSVVFQILLAFGDRPPQPPVMADAAGDVTQGQVEVGD